MSITNTFAMVSAITIADASRARKALGWAPKIGFEQLVKMMVDADLERLA